MDRALHHRVRQALVDHRDRVRRRCMGIGNGDECIRGNIGAELLRRRLNAARVADQDRLDETMLRREQSAAERIAVLGANDGGLERRQSRSERDERREMIDAVHDQRRQVARLGQLGHSRRVDFRRSFADDLSEFVLDAGVEQGDRLFALLATDDGDLEPVADMNAPREAQVLSAVKRSRAGKDVAEHRRDERADPHRRARLAYCLACDCPPGAAKPD